MKPSSSHIIVPTIIALLLASPALTFVAQLNNNDQANSKRQLSFMDIFKGSSSKSTASSDSVQRLLQLLQLADSFSTDPNINVAVTVNYKNSPNDKPKVLLARKLLSVDESPKKQKKSEKAPVVKRKAKKAQKKQQKKTHGNKRTV